MGGWDERPDGPGPGRGADRRGGARARPGEAEAPSGRASEGGGRRRGGRAASRRRAGPLPRRPEFPAAFPAGAGRSPAVRRGGGGGPGPGLRGARLGRPARSSPGAAARASGLRGASRCRAASGWQKPAPGARSSPGSSVFLCFPPGGLRLRRALRPE